MFSTIQQTTSRMGRCFVTVILLALIPNHTIAQSDSLRNEIAHYVSIDENMSTNGRLMLRDLINADGDPNKIRAVLWTLQMELNLVHKPLTRIEESSIYFLLGDFKVVLRMFDHVEHPIVFENETNHPQDNLLETLQSKIKNDSTNLEAAIDSAEFDIASKAFLRLYYAKVTSWMWTNYSQKQALNQKAGAFLQEFPTSMYNESVRAHIGEIYRLTGWSQRFYLQGGFYNLTDHLSQRFTNPWTIGIGIDISYKRFSFLFRGATGSCVTKESIPFRAATWGKAFDVDFEIMEFAAGCKVVTNDRLDIVPFMGCSWTNFKPAEEDENNDPVLKQIGFRKKPAYSVGIFTDVRIKKDRIEDESVRFDKFLRLRYAYEMPRLERTMLGFDGNMHSITIAVGIAAIWQHRQL